MAFESDTHLRNENNSQLIDGISSIASKIYQISEPNNFFLIENTSAETMVPSDFQSEQPLFIYREVESDFAA